MSLPLEIPITLPDGQKYDQPTGLFINNEFVKSKAGKTIDSINPATAEVNGTVYAAEAEDVDIAVKAAKTAFKKWKQISGMERGIMLLKVVDALEKNKELYASIEAWDSGKNKAQNAIYDIEECIKVFRYYAGWADKITGKVIQNNPEKFAYTVHEPYGVCGQIIPWNYPLSMASWKLAPALATGNVVVLKSSEITPLSILVFAKAFKEAGFPPGVVNILSGYGRDCGKALVEHPDVRKVAFTGSTATGKIIQQMASEGSKAVTLELGGKSPFIVRADADIDQAIKWAAIGIMSNQGQICSGTSRIYIHKDIYEEFVNKLADHVKKEYKQGDMYDEDAVVGPQASKMQFDKVLGYIEEGKKQGARVVLGGEKNSEGHLAKGYFIKPTIFADVTKDMTIVNEEIFGPVVCCGVFETDEEVIEYANQTKYGLAASIFTKDITTAHKMAREIESGMVWINSSNDVDIQVPFGGVKSSGVGRELGEYGVQVYTEAKAITVNLGPNL